MTANNEASNASFIEIRGREGSTTIHRKKVSHIDDVSDAEIQKLLGIARRLPAVAFDALFDFWREGCAASAAGQLCGRFGKP